MGTIETTYDRARDLTIAKASGRMTAEDHREWIKTYYDGDKVTSRILWDVREADFSQITRQDILDHVHFARQLIADARKGGKTAVLIDKDMLGFGLSRMRETYFDMEGVPGTRKPPCAQKISTLKSDVLKRMGLLDLS